MPLSNKLFDLEVSLRAALRLQQQRPPQSGTIDLFLAIGDHFEPHHGQPSDEIAHARMQEWQTLYPQIAQKHQDADGCPPTHSFFYPFDEYDAWEFERLVEVCAAGWGEIELHLHHRDDTEASLRAKFEEAVALYHSHGALTTWPDGRPAYGFIHGNWALDNSRHDNGRNYCGVNNELTLLAQTGCYADFTFPAWQQTAQPQMINTIYYATDDPALPKSYDRGRPARVGGSTEGTLLLVTGPLVPYWRKGRPAMDDGDLASYRRYSPERLDRWVRAGIHVEGRPDRIFIKLYCHGAADRNRAVLLGEDLDALFTDAEARYNDGQRYRLHYVTAREMFNIIKATEANAPLDLKAARDYLLPHPHQ